MGDEPRRIKPRSSEDRSAGNGEVRSESNLDDGEILDEIARGELEHFDSFVNCYKAKLFGYIRHRVRDAHWAEDLTQEVFLRAFRAGYRGAYLGRSNARAWLFTIANNCVIDFLRAERSRGMITQTQLRKGDGHSGPIAVREARTGNPAAGIIRSEDQARAEQLLAKLPEPQRIVVVLKVLSELRFGEIAEVLGCSVQTVKSRMRYGLDKLQQMLPGDQEER